MKMRTWKMTDNRIERHPLLKHREALKGLKGERLMRTFSQMAKLGTRGEMFSSLKMTKTTMVVRTEQSKADKSKQEAQMLLYRKALEEKR